MLCPTDIISMVKYEYFKKLKQMGIYLLPLLIFCQTASTYFRIKNGDIRGFAVKSQFSGKIGYLNNFSVVSNENVSNSYHF